MAYESSGILMAAVFLPLLLSPVAYFIGKRKGINSVTWFSFTVLLISAILLIIPGIRLSSENPIYQESYVWSQFGNFGLKLDGFKLSIRCDDLCSIYYPCHFFKAIHDTEDCRTI